MEQIAEGVYQVSRGVNSFIVDGDQGVTLIDTGMPRRQGAIVEGLSDIGRSAKDIRTILITHAHFDHVGGADVLQGASGAMVLSSHEEASAIQGDRKPQPALIFDRVPFGATIAGWFPKARPVLVDQTVAEGHDSDLPEEFRAIDSPGHTTGHLSYLLDRSGGIMFVGDAAVASHGDISRGWANRKTEAIDGSITHLSEFAFEIAVFGHSGPITSAASSAFTRFKP
jgi:glyoxylase-like metal-dependent hydrolase (beta-lactamase superfamily II)